MNERTDPDQTAQDAQSAGQQPPRRQEPDVSKLSGREVYQRILATRQEADKAAAEHESELQKIREIFESDGIITREEEEELLRLDQQRLEHNRRRAAETRTLRERLEKMVMPRGRGGKALTILAAVGLAGLMLASGLYLANFSLTLVV